MNTDSIGILFLSIFILLFIGIMLFILLNGGKNYVGAYKGFIFGGLLYYGIVPFIYIVSGKINDLISEGPQNKGLTDFFLSYLLLILFFVIIDITYKKRNSHYQKKEVKYGIAPRQLKKSSLYIGFFCLIVGGFSLYLFFRAFGGTLLALALAEELRSNSTNLSDYIPHQYAILVIPARLITVAPFLLWSTYVLKQGSQWWLKVLIIVSSVLALLFYLFYAGRAPLIMFILCLVIPLLYGRIKHLWTIIIISGFCAIPLLGVLDELFLYFSTGSFELEDMDYLRFLHQFTYPIQNVIYSFDIANIYGYRFGKDFILDILGFIPGLDFGASYYVTSEFYGGSTWEVTGGTPNDIITYSILQFSVLGIIIFPIVLGFIFSKIDYYLNYFENDRVKRILSTLLAFNVFLFVGNADFISVLKGALLVVVPFVILSSIKRLYEKPIKV